MMDFFRFEPPLPYSLSLTAARFTRFPELIDRFDGHTYKRLLEVDGQFLLLIVTQSGPATQAVLEVRITGRGARSQQARTAATKVLGRALGAVTEIVPFYRALTNDAILGSSIRTFKGLRVAGWPDLWETLVTTVLCQQVNLPFAYGVRRELVRAFGSHAQFYGETFYTFPTPDCIEQEGVDRLRQFRLSRGKAETIVRLAGEFRRGKLSEAGLQDLADEAVIDRLTTIRGIGRWTAETALLRGLGRPDAFPAGDLGVVKYLAQGLLGRPKAAHEKEMRTYAERWRPYRGLALVYAYAELQRKQAN